MFEIISNQIANINVIEMCTIKNNKIYLDNEEVYMTFNISGTLNNNCLKLDKDALYNFKKLYKILKKDIPNLNKFINNDEISLIAEQKYIYNVSLEINDNNIVFTNI